MRKQALSIDAQSVKIDFEVKWFAYREEKENDDFFRIYQIWKLGKDRRREQLYFLEA